MKILYLFIISFYTLFLCKEVISSDVFHSKFFDIDVKTLNASEAKINSINDVKYISLIQLADKILDNKKTELIVEHKADEKYITSSAASILAKVRREEIVSEIKEKYGNTGSGYPADPNTKKFIAENWAKCPEIFRKSWSTYKKVVENKGQKKLF